MENIIYKIYDMIISFYVVNFCIYCYLVKKNYNMIYVKFIIFVVFFFNLGMILNVECVVIKVVEGFECLDVDFDNIVFYENGGKL